MDNNNDKYHEFDADDYTYSIPKEATTWLGKYGITRAEVVHFNLLWNKRTDSLVFPIIINDKVVLTSERYFGDNPFHPKYVTNGSKNKNNLFITHPRNKESLVFVEDFVSAIKVSRFTGACPILGATINANAVKWAVEHFKRIRVWLDSNKAAQSLLEASKLSQYCSDVRSIYTDLDPKEYSNTELMTILEKYGVSSPVDKV